MQSTDSLKSINRISTLRNRLSSFAARNVLLKNFSVLTISKFLTQFISVFASIKIARSLTPDNFGTYNLLLLHIGIFAVVSALGLKQIIIRNIARNNSILKKTFHTAIRLRALGLVLSISAFVIYYFFYGEYSWLLFALVLIGLIAEVGYDLCESAAFGMEKMEFSGIIDFLRSLAWLMSILLIPQKYLTLQLIFILYVFFSCLKSVIYFFSIYKDTLIKNFQTVPVTRKDMMVLTKESFPFYYLSLMTILSNSVPILFLEYRSSIAEIGYFNIANKILAPIGLVISTIMIAIFPYLSRLYTTSHEGFIKSLKNIFVIICIFNIAGAFGVTLFRKEFIFLLYGEKYLSSSLVLGYQVWYIAVYSPVWLIGSVLTTIDKQKILGRMSIVCTIIQLPILWYGAQYGAQYLSAAFVVATAINLIIHIYVVRWYIKEIKFIFYLKILIILTAGYFLSLLIPEDFNLLNKFIFFFVVMGIGGYFIYVKYKEQFLQFLHSRKG